MDLFIEERFPSTRAGDIVLRESGSTNRYLPSKSVLFYIHLPRLFFSTAQKKNEWCWAPPGYHLIKDTKCANTLASVLPGVLFPLKIKAVFSLKGMTISFKMVTGLKNSPVGSTMPVQVRNHFQVQTIDYHYKSERDLGV